MLPTLPIIIILGWLLDYAIHARWGNIPPWVERSDGYIVASSLTFRLAVFEVVVKLFEYGFCGSVLAVARRDRSWPWILSLVIVQVVLECFLRSWTIIWGDLETWKSKAIGLPPLLYAIMPGIALLGGFITFIGGQYLRGK
jgi:hypothetical protein